MPQPSGPDKITAKVLEQALSAAKRGRISTVVVASTTGRTARLLLEVLDTFDGKVVVVAHGGAKGRARFDEVARLELADRGVPVLIQANRLRLPGILHRLLRKAGLNRWQRTLKKIKAEHGTGICVCHKLLRMSSKAGLIGSGHVVAIAGMNRGADSAGIFEIDFHTRLPMLIQVIVAPVVATVLSADA